MAWHAPLESSAVHVVVVVGLLFRMCDIQEKGSATDPRRTELEQICVFAAAVVLEDLCIIHSHVPSSARPTNMDNQ